MMGRRLQPVNTFGDRGRRCPCERPPSTCLFTAVRPDVTVPGAMKRAERAARRQTHGFHTERRSAAVARLGGPVREEGAARRSAGARRTPGVLARRLAALRALRDPGAPGAGR